MWWGWITLKTLPQIFIGVSELGVAFVITARSTRGWPPRNTKNISDIQFNNIHWINDRINFQIKGWIDNFFVTIITTLHNLEETNRRIHKKPRFNQAKKDHLE